MSHDQYFKILILDCPRQALAFFAAAEAADIDPGVRILPVRREQLQECLGERFREFDVPLLVGWPDGRREAILFVLKEEGNARRFSIHRLAHYCLDLVALLETERVVLVVIFLRTGAGAPRRTPGRGSSRLPRLPLPELRPGGAALRGVPRERQSGRTTESAQYTSTLSD